MIPNTYRNSNTIRPISLPHPRLPKRPPLLSQQELRDEILRMVG
jgi:hypothetical protein